MTGVGWLGALAACTVAVATCALAQTAPSQEWRPAKGPLMTGWAKDVSPDKALGEYPRPMMVRKDWLNLNGLWDYAVTGLLGEGKTRELPPLDDASKRWMTRKVAGLFKSLWANKDSTGQSGDFYCQIVDVEDECNGLLSYDRAVFKVDANQVAAAARGDLLRVQEYDELVPTAIAQAVSWRHSFAKPAEDWFKPDFDASAWKEAPAGFGTKGTPGAVVRTEWNTPDVWLRREFVLEDVKGRELLLRLHHDEDVEVFINGVLAFREGGFIGAYEEVEMTAEALGAIKTGKNVLAVHCHQTTGGQYADVGIVGRRR